MNAGHRHDGDDEWSDRPAKNGSFVTWAAIVGFLMMIAGWLAVALYTRQMEQIQENTHVLFKDRDEFAAIKARLMRLEDEAAQEKKNCGGR